MPIHEAPLRARVPFDTRLEEMAHHDAVTECVPPSPARVMVKAMIAFYLVLGLLIGIVGAAVYVHTANASLQGADPLVVVLILLSGAIVAFASLPFVVVLRVLDLQERRDAQNLEMIGLLHDIRDALGPGPAATAPPFPPPAPTEQPIARPPD